MSTLCNLSNFILQLYTNITIPIMCMKRNDRVVLLRENLVGHGDMVTHAFNSSAGDTEAGGFL